MTSPQRFLRVLLSVIPLLFPLTAFCQDSRDAKQRGKQDDALKLTDETWLIVGPGKLEETVGYLRLEREMKNAPKNRIPVHYSDVEIESFRQQLAVIGEQISVRSTRDQTVFAGLLHVVRFDSESFQIGSREGVFFDLSRFKTHQGSCDGSRLSLRIESKTGMPQKGGVDGFSETWNKNIEVAICDRHSLDGENGTYFDCKATSIQLSGKLVRDEVEFELYPLRYIETLVDSIGPEKSKSVN